MVSSGQIHLFISQISGRLNRLEEYALQTGLDENVSAAEIKIISAIGAMQNEKMGSIAAALGISMATLTVSCDKLEARGFITRRRDPCDKRAVRASLTEKGAVAHRFHTSFVQSLVDMALSELDSSERDALVRGAEKISRLLSDLGR